MSPPSGHELHFPNFGSWGSRVSRSAALRASASGRLLGKIDAYIWHETSAHPSRKVEPTKRIRWSAANYRQSDCVCPQLPRIAWRMAYKCQD